MSVSTLLKSCLLPLCGLAAADELMPPPYVCQRATEPITIDGKADEPAWQKARPLSPLRAIHDAFVQSCARIRMLWDDHYLYIHADVPSEHLWATQREHDSIIFHDPDFEVFIDPLCEDNHYIELEINQLNTVWELFIARTYRHANPVILHDWDMPGLKHAVHLRGTLNNAGDIDKGWSVELAIPWRSITSHGALPRADEPPQPGTAMRFNFSCVGWAVQEDASSPTGYAKHKGADGKPLPESNSVWAPTGVVNIHMPEHWGRVVFSDKPAGTWESVQPDPEDDARLALYAYAERQENYRKEHGVYDTALIPPQGMRVMADARFFSVSTTCARTGRELRLNSDGAFTAQQVADPMPEIFLWVHPDHVEDTAAWNGKFAKYRAAGVDTVIIGGSAEQLAALTPLARRAGLRVIAWVWALNRPQDADFLKEHPECYAVSRNGKSCAVEKERPYVGYYQFLCPNHPAVREHLRSVVDSYAAIPGVSAIQLDYMRLPDVILPRGLWEKYGLTMDHEMAPYDFCYCDTCRRLFREKYGRDVQEDAEHDAEWREFRLQSVADLASALCGRARVLGKGAACAVFPTPQLASKLVRQDWSRFPLDLALPMDYFSFYNEPAAWVDDMAAAAMQQTQGRFPIAPGLHLPDYDTHSLPQALDRLRALRVPGISLFSDEEFTPALQQALKEWRK